MDDFEDLTIKQIILKLFTSAPDLTRSRRSLSVRCGVNDREMRRAVAQLRKEGHLIVADKNGGYRKATSAEDVRRFTASLRSRIIDEAQTIRAMEAEAVKQFGDFEQLPLEIE